MKKKFSTQKPYNAVIKKILCPRTLKIISMTRSYVTAERLRLYTNLKLKILFFAK